MPRSYIRITEKSKWTPETLQKAVHAVESKDLSIRKASREYGISFSTLRDRMSNNHLGAAKLGRNPVFTMKQEEELIEHIRTLSRTFYGLTLTGIQKIAFEFAESNNIEHPFSTVKKMAGRDWAELFLKRNPAARSCLIKPTKYNSATIKKELHFFFYKLVDAMEKYKFTRSRIFNVAEIEFLSRLEGTQESTQKRKKITVICSVNPSGLFLPSTFIFPKKQGVAKYAIKRGPYGSLYQCSSNGWVTKEFFCEWLEYFSEEVSPSPSYPALLILDNSSCHVSLKAYNYCKENGIILVALPLRLAHKLQPLDITVFGPFRDLFNTECDSYLKLHTSRKIDLSNFGSIFNKAFRKVSTIDRAFHGFREAGIFPLNPAKFVPDFVYEDSLKNKVESMLQLSSDVKVEDQLEEGCATDSCGNNTATHSFDSKGEDSNSCRSNERPSNFGGGKMKPTDSCDINSRRWIRPDLFRRPAISNRNLIFADFDSESDSDVEMFDDPPQPQVPQPFILEPSPELSDVSEDTSIIIYNANPNERITDVISGNMDTVSKNVYQLDLSSNSSITQSRPPESEGISQIKNAENVSNIDSYFSNVAKFAKTLSPLDQVILQKKIANMIFDMKIRQLSNKQ